MSRRGSHQGLWFARGSKRRHRGGRRNGRLAPTWRRQFWVEQLEERNLLAADWLLPIGVSAPYDPEVGAATAAGGGSAAPAIPLEDTFFLHSNPGATKTIYLDFDGFTIRDTVWNTAADLPNIVQPAFDTDGDVFAFSDAELMLIQEMWEQVSEDYIPFDVNVTTEDPGIEALRNTGAGDTEWGIRIVIGGSTYDWFTPTDGRVVGGVAYLTSFNWDTDTPGLVFGADFGGYAKAIAEAISHETGHTLGLGHDGQDRFYFDISDPDPANWEWVRVNFEYYAGHADPPTGAPTGWAPIMGVSYYQPLTQWSQGQYFNSTNIEDDLAIITTDNGFDYRVDDHGDSTASATPLGQDIDEKIYFGEGIIERNTDVDYFEFTVEGLGELVSFDITPFHRSPNLDLLVKLYNSSGVQIGGDINPLDVLEASITERVLAPGTYYITIEGASRPITFIDPVAHPFPQTDPPGPNDETVPDASDWGYSDYGSLGQYSITGTRKKGLVVGIDFDEAGGTGPADWNLFSGGGAANVISNLISEAGVATPYDLTISSFTPEGQPGNAIQGFASESPIDPADIPNHPLPLDELDGYLATGGETLSFVWSDLEPLAVYQVYVFGHADQEVRNVVEIVGGQWAGEAQQTFNFTQVIDQNQLLVNSTAEPGSLDLSTLSYLVVANEAGEIAINVTNELGFALAVAGLAIAPTKLGSIQGQKWNDLNGNGIQGGGEGGLAGWAIYLDLNNNGQLDLITTPEQPVTSNAPNVPQVLLDHNTVKNELEFTQPGLIVDVNVTLDITHTYDGDLDVYLKSPTGTRVKLFDDVGGFNDNFTNTTLDDEAATSITAGTAPFTGSFRPEEFLSAFIGEFANGIWELEITDDALNDTGVLNGWSVTITLAGFDTYLEPVTVTDENGNYSFADLRPGVYYVREHYLEDQFLDGWRQTWQPPPVTVTSGARIQNIDFGNWIPTLQPGSIQGVKFNDEDGDGLKDAEESGLEGWTIYIDSNSNGVLDTATEPLTVASTDVPQPITDFSSVPTQVNFDGIGTILKVTVTLDITHSFVGDLDAFLTSPSGTTVQLFSGVGGQFNDFNDLTLDDDAENSIAIIHEFGYDPNTGYTGTWKPMGQLQDFLGEDAFGAWTLLVRDTAFADQGVLNSWSLTVTFGELSTTTNGDGDYIFENLPEGQYIIREEQQSGWTQVPPAVSNLPLGDPDPAAVWQGSQWEVDINGLDNPSYPSGPDSHRNVTDVNFGNRSGAPLLPGDYNQDGMVDAADYILWRRFLNTAASPPFSGADGDGSGMVDQGDHVVWAENFGNTSGGGGTGQQGAGSGDAGAESESSVVAAASESAPTAAESPMPAAATVSPQLVTTGGQDASSAETDASKSMSTVQTVAASPVFISTSSTLGVSSRIGVSGRIETRADVTSDAALVAWLASHSTPEKASDEDDPVDAYSEVWSEDLSDSLDSIDSVFEVLGAAVA